MKQFTDDTNNIVAKAAVLAVDVMRVLSWVTELQPVTHENERCQEKTAGDIY